MISSDSQREGVGYGTTPLTVCTGCIVQLTHLLTKSAEGREGEGGREGARGERGGGGRERGREGGEEGGREEGGRECEGTAQPLHTQNTWINRYFRRLANYYMYIHVYTHAQSEHICLNTGLE